MANTRVYKLAKELGVKSALILELLDLVGREVKSDLSTIDGATADLVRKRIVTALAAEKRRLEAEKPPEPEVTEEPEVIAVAEAEETPAADRESAAVETETPPSEPAAATAEYEPDEPTPVAAVEETPAEFTPAAEDPLPAPEKNIEEAPAPAAVAAAPPAGAHIPKAPTPDPTARPRVVPQAAHPAKPTSTRASSIPAPPGAPRAKRVFEAKVIPTKAELRTRLQRLNRPTGATRPVGAPPVPGRPGRPMPGRPGAGGPGPGMSGGPPPGGQKPGLRKKKKSRDKDRREERGQAPVPMSSKPKDLPPVPETITLSEAVTVKELAEKLNRKSKDVIAKLISRGVLATINQPLDPVMAVEIAGEFGSTATIMSFEEEAQLGVAQPGHGAATQDEKDALGIEAALPENLVVRPPVVTVMGHVDHGKTSLLDAFRKTDVVSGEHGGITQHIGAYQVTINDRGITFLDTPGHEAFTLMRARGAKATDIVVLVVAADDGVKPQTIEALDHAREAGVPLVIAINKMDKPGANPGRVKQQLADRGVLVEEYGGQTVACEVSAKKKEGLDHLLEMILLVADLQELRADPGQPANGVVLEARLDRGRGVLSTVLVQSGTLHVGDPFIAGSAYGKVRAMVNEHGERVTEAGPSTPVEVMGFAGEPAAGDTFQAVADESKARQIAQFREDKIRELERASSRGRHATLESLARDIKEGQAKELAILLKADVQGSIEAIRGALGELPSDKVRIRIIRSSIGAITQADVLLASASNAIIAGFNVRPDRAAQEAARQEGIEVRQYTVIYDVIDEIRQVMIGKLEPEIKETVLGQAEVRQTFKVPKMGMIAGSYVTDGKVTRSAEVRLIRDHVLVYTGRVGSLRRFKDDVSEVKSGYECGIGIAGYNDLKEGDTIEFFVKEKVAVESL